MIVQKQMLQQLKDDFRLNIYEVNIWTALLSRGIATAGELSEISGVPRSRCYDVLESLEKKGFIIMKLGKPIKYIAVPPEEIIERVKKTLVSEKETNLKILNDIKGTDLFSDLESLYSSGIEHIKAEDISDLIVGKSNILRFIKSFLEKAQSKIIISADEENVLKIINSNESLFKRLADSDVSVSIFSNLENNALKKNKLKYLKIKPNTLNSRFIIVDDKELFIFTSNKDSPADFESAIWLQSKFFVKSFAKMFLKHN